MDLQKIIDQSVELLTTVGWKVLAAILLFVVGRRLIDFAVRVMRRGLKIGASGDPDPLALLLQDAEDLQIAG